MASRLAVDLIHLLRDNVGVAAVLDDDADIGLYLSDKWPRSLLLDKPSTGKTVVVLPETRDAVRQVIKIANDCLVPVVTRGGGSGVCGAVLASDNIPIKILLSLERLNRVRVIDEAQYTVEAEAGILGNVLEERLDKANLTLGHFPASLGISSLGGWLATRSSGQASTRYGKIEQMVDQVEVVLGNGELVKLDNSNGTVGPDLLPLILGSEGTLGVITAARLKVKPKVVQRLFAHFTFRCWEEGLAALQTIGQSGFSPAVARLYDGFDARHTLLSAAKTEADLGWLKRKLLERDGLIVALSKVVDHWYKPHLILISETPAATASVVEAEHEALIKLVTKHHGHLVQDNAAEEWFKHRYALSFEKVQRLVADDCFIDTIDLYVPWNKIVDVYRSIKTLVLPVAAVFAHLSHLTPQGACMYLTFVGRKAKGRLEVYDSIWRNVLDYCAQNGVGISDHHGVGVLKAEAFRQTRGPQWFKLFQAVKAYADPKGILNPGQFGFAHY